MLLDEFKFKRALIPLNFRNTNLNLPQIQYNDNGWPLCFKDPSTPMKPAGWSREKVEVTDLNGYAQKPNILTVNGLLPVKILATANLVEE